MELVRLIKICLNETYNKVRTGKHLSYPKWSKTMSCLIASASQLCLECAIRKVKENQMGVKFIGTRQLLSYADDENLLGENIIKVKKVRAIPVTGRGSLYVCGTSKFQHFLYNRLTDGSKVVSFTRRPPFSPQEVFRHSFFCTLLFRHQNAVGNRGIRIVNRAVENVVEAKIFWNDSNNPKYDLKY
jgi:hypothetical protein